MSHTIPCSLESSCSCSDLELLSLGAVGNGSERDPAVQFMIAEFDATLPGVWVLGGMLRLRDSEQIWQIALDFVAKSQIGLCLLRSGMWLCRPVANSRVLLCSPG